MIAAAVAMLGMATLAVDKAPGPPHETRGEARLELVKACPAGFKLNKKGDRCVAEADGSNDTARPGGPRGGGSFF
jgi:hypothetical protein